MRQREQLENTESRLDEINNTLRFSQKHISSIKVNNLINFVKFEDTFMMKLKRLFSLLNIDQFIA